MSRNESRPDYYSGIPWVYVSGHEVRGHPKGRLTPALWIIACYFILLGATKTYLFAAGGLPVWMVLLGGVLPLLTGLGLILRAPVAIVLAVAQAGVTLWQILTGGWNVTGVIFLVEGLIALGIVIYLVDGDRPNFIYRHRYRKYSALKEDGDDSG